MYVRIHIKVATVGAIFQIRLICIIINRLFVVKIKIKTVHLLNTHTNAIKVEHIIYMYSKCCLKFGPK